MSSPRVEGSFSACDNIAAFYQNFDIRSEQTTGPLGGKTFVWHVDKGDKNLTVRCFCTFGTLGFGKIRAEYPVGTTLFSRTFRGIPSVDPESAKLQAKSIILGRDHEIDLPVPDVSKKA